MLVRRKVGASGKSTGPYIVDDIIGDLHAVAKAKCVYITRTNIHQNNDVFDHTTLDSTFKIINIAGAGKWWPEEGEDSLNAARWNEYQCRKLVKVSFSVTDWRIYMERQMKRTLTSRIYIKIPLILNLMPIFYHCSPSASGGISHSQV